VTRAGTKDVFENVQGQDQEAGEKSLAGLQGLPKEEDNSSWKSVNRVDDMLEFVEHLDICGLDRMTTI